MKPRWRRAPKRLRLASNDVDIWRASLDVNAGSVAILKSTLAADELARADRFHFDRDRDAFIVARAFLRVILGRYLNCHPCELQFQYGPYGKPALAGRDAETLSFNLSHADGLALYAITPGRDVGIDVERIRPDMETECLAGRFFSREEFGKLRSLPRHIRRNAFFSCWSRKEAYVKARGEGLFMPLQKFEVSLAPDESPELISVNGIRQGTSDWVLKELIPRAGFVAALAIQARECNFRFWKLPPYIALRESFSKICETSCSFSSLTVYSQGAGL